jgi:hypothetical protein
MSGFDQKDPSGADAMTGRQGGMCRRTEKQSLGSNVGDGIGDGRGGARGVGSRCGQGQGQGLGQGRSFVRDAEQSQRVGEGRISSEELSDLKEQYKAAQKTLNMIEQKIAALESGK